MKIAIKLLIAIILISASTATVSRYQAVKNKHPSLITANDKRNFAIDVTDWAYLVNNEGSTIYSLNSHPIASVESKSKAPLSENFISFRGPEQPLGGLDLALPFVYLSDQMTIYWSFSKKSIDLPQPTSDNKFTISGDATNCFDAIPMDAETVIVDCAQVGAGQINRNYLYYVNITNQSIYRTQDTGPRFDQFTLPDRRFINYQELGNNKFVYRYAPIVQSFVEIFDATINKPATANFTISSSNFTGTNLNVTDVSIINGQVYIASQTDSTIRAAIPKANSYADFDIQVFQMTQVPYALRAFYGNTKFGFNTMLAVAGSSNLYILDVNYQQANKLDPRGLIYDSVAMTQTVSEPNLQIRVSEHFYAIFSSKNFINVFYRKPEKLDILHYSNGLQQDIKVAFDAINGLFFQVYDGQVQLFNMNRPIFYNDGSFQQQSTLLINQEAVKFNFLSYEGNMAYGYWYANDTVFDKYPHTDFTGESEIDSQVTSIQNFKFALDHNDGGLIDSQSIYVSLSSGYLPVGDGSIEAGGFNLFVQPNPAIDKTYILYWVAQNADNKAFIVKCAKGNAEPLITQIRCFNVSNGLGGSITTAALRMSNNTQFLALITDSEQTVLHLYSSDFSKSKNYNNYECRKLIASQSYQAPFIFCVQDQLITLISGDDPQNAVFNNLDFKNLGISSFIPLDVRTTLDLPTLIFVKQNSSILIIDLSLAPSKYNLLATVDLSGAIKSDYDFVVSKTRILISSKGDNQMVYYDITNLRNPLLIPQSNKASATISQDVLVSNGLSDIFFAYVDDKFGAHDASLTDVSTPIETFTTDGYTPLNAIISSPKFGVNFVMFKDSNSKLQAMLMHDRLNVHYAIKNDSVPFNQFLYPTNVTATGPNSNKFIVHLDLFLTNHTGITTLQSKLPDFNMTHSDKVPLFEYSHTWRDVFKGSMSGVFALSSEQPREAGLFDVKNPVQTELFKIPLPKITIVGGYMGEDYTYALFQALESNYAIVQFSTHDQSIQNQTVLPELNQKCDKFFKVDEPNQFGVYVCKDSNNKYTVSINNLVGKDHSSFSSQLDNVFAVKINSNFFGIGESAVIVLGCSGINLIVEVFKASASGFQLTQLGQFIVGNSYLESYSFDSYPFSTGNFYDGNDYPALKLFIADIDKGFGIFDLIYNTDNNVFTIFDVDRVMVSGSDVFVSEHIDDDEPFVAIGIKSCSVTSDAFICNLVLAPQYGYAYLLTWDYSKGLTGIINRFYPYFNSTFTNEIYVKDTLFEIVVSGPYGLLTVNYMFADKQMEPIYNLGVFKSQGHLFQDNVADNFIWNTVEVAYQEFTFVSKTFFFDTFNMSVSNYTLQGIRSQYLQYSAAGAFINDNTTNYAVNSTNISLVLDWSPNQGGGPGVWAWIFFILALLFVAGIVLLCFVPLRKGVSGKVADQESLLVEND